jgi:hypothetical protein
MPASMSHLSPGIQGWPLPQIVPHSPVLRSQLSPATVQWVFDVHSTH